MVVMAASAANIGSRARPWPALADSAERLDLWQALWRLTGQFPDNYCHLSAGARHKHRAGAIGPPVTRQRLAPEHGGPWVAAELARGRPREPARESNHRPRSQSTRQRDPRSSLS